MGNSLRAALFAGLFAFGISDGTLCFATPTYSYGPEGVIVPAAGNPENQHCPSNSTSVLSGSNEYQSDLLACGKISGSFSIVGTMSWAIEGPPVIYKCVRCDCFNPNPPHNRMSSDSCFSAGMAAAASTATQSDCDSTLTDSFGSSSGTKCVSDKTGEKDEKLPKAGPVPPVKPSDTKQDATTTASTPTGNQTADQQTCQQKATDASQCCQNPMSCLNTAIQLGYVNSGDAALAQGYSSGALTTNQATIQQSCTQLQQASVAMQNVNSGLSALCYARKSACETTCQGYKQTYSSATFDGAISACNSLNTNVVALGQSANQNVQNAMVAQQCQQVTTASAKTTNPMSTSPAATPAPQPIDDSSGGAPSLDGAAVGRSDPGLFTQQPITGSYSGTDPSNFDVGTTGVDGTQQQPSFPVTGAEPASATIVPNNTGGAIPASGDGGANGSSAGPSGSSGSQAANSKASTDVLHGNRSGGGFVSGGASSSGFGDNGRDSSGFNFGKFAGKFGKKAAGQDLSKYQGLDLKQYLPGGARDPHRGIASVGRGQIRPSGDDLFIAITSRIKLMCKLGNLLDCR